MDKMKGKGNKLASKDLYEIAKSLIHYQSEVQENIKYRSGTKIK